MKNLILLFSAVLSFFNMSAQESSFLINGEIAKQDSFVVYAELTKDASDRVEFNFGQETEGGYFYGDITIKLVDENDKNILMRNKINAAYPHKLVMKIVNDLVKAGWTLVGGVNTTDCQALFMKEVKNESEIIQGLRFQKVKK